MKVIFLDIDGVLNDCHTRQTTSEGWLFVNDDLVKNLQHIVQETGAKIVLSSTWRMDWHKEDESKNSPSFNELRAKLKEFDLELLDRTGEFLHGGNARGKEIAFWIDQWQGEPVDKFVIIDDWDDMWRLKDHLIQTNAEDGLREPQAALAIAYLNEVDDES